MAKLPMRLVLTGIIILVFGLAAYPSLRAPEERTDRGAIVRRLAGAEPKAKVTIPIVLREGGDASHEMAHVFGALTPLAGTGTARFVASPPTLEVSYDPSKVDERAIRGAL